ncbi:hypothetical protein MATR_33320 [Marivirga tractuosa]|uniref:Uncharacterized protein n=1 Tax=Marivirga tractuosa (strain ATCC 23168 / DSM 4126 / NBRC 15989 / NCIMB 1408 / VKM B-1430 / H-43) TaxID=643867 RepID=E4TSA5_MARTH|nr:hypothetical protein [Marivirga tractuosa]ADR22822.1 hypothetical protein Ftrac_2844 [Marivirga tractuosa DSM 4126]BDD16507.1 hypothetical protein MATR_33320 [Marivirga tractuosa]
MSLIFCLLAPALVTCLWLKHQKRQVKREVKWKIIDGIDKSELVLIQLTKAEAKEKLHWEHSREFEFKGEMYDVVEFEETADSIKYWCWWDYEETALNKKLAEVVNNLFGNNPEKQEKEQKLISFYQSLFSEKVFQWQALQFFGISNPITGYKFYLEDFINSVPSPPPQIVV